MGARLGLLADFFRFYAPEIGFHRPAAKASGRDSAPIQRTGAQARNDARFKPGIDLRIGVGLRVYWQQVGLDQHRAHPGQQRVMHPAACTIAVLNLAPIAVFRGDLQRHAAPLEHPVDSMGQRRTSANIPFGGFHRDIAWQGQVCDRAAFVLRKGGHWTACDKQRAQDHQITAFHR